MRVLSVAYDTKYYVVTLFSVLVAGGDTLVHTVVNAIVKKAQFDNGIVLGGKESLQSCLQPIGIIPCGVSNVIAHTVHGTSDMVTAALDIVYGESCALHLLARKVANLILETMLCLLG